MKKYLSLILALVLIATAIPFTALNASAAPTDKFMGDANDDGDVTTIDARITLQVASGNKQVNNTIYSRIDMNGDGKVTTIDARTVLQTAAGNVEKVPVDNGLPTPDELKGILRNFGYEYDAEQNIFYTHLNPWQRWFGFTDAYDSAAAYATMWYMTLKIDFEYDDLLWRLQWWKGQYGVLEGAELGVYTKKPENEDFPFYKCAENENLLTMYFEYYQTVKDYNEDNVLFIREEQEHWWLTGFKFGVCDPTKNVVKATLLVDSKMADGVEEGLKNVTDKTGRPNGFKEYKSWIPVELQGHNFYIREKVDDQYTKFTVVWKDAGYLNYGQEHVCEFGEPVVIKQPTCVSEGVQRKTCTICAYEVDEVIPATGVHTMGIPVVTTLPGCATEGVTKIPCIHCDYFETGSVPATGLHILGAEQVVTPPTCTAPGAGKKVCIHCDYYETTIIPATGHDMETPVETKAPTCSQSGEMRADCKNCEHYEVTPVPATGAHNMSDWTVVTAPTTEADGLKEKVCQNDGCDHKVTEPIEKLPVVEPEEPEVPDTEA